MRIEARSVWVTAHPCQIAVVATTPWDSYLIRSRVWTYPTTAIVGPTLFQIPIEEIFFFVIQTYDTSLLYLILSKPTFHPIHLRCEGSRRTGKLLQIWRTLGQLLLLVAIAIGGQMVGRRGEGLYMGLIVIWAGPFVLLLWYDFALHLQRITDHFK